MSNITQGDNSKSKEGRVVILVRNMSYCPILQFYKVLSNILKGIPVTEQMKNLFQTKQRETTPKARTAELSFLYATRRLVLFYISAKYHRNIPKGIRVTERTRNLFHIKQRVITPKEERQSFHSCTRHGVRSCSTFLPSIIKIFQRVFKLQSGQEVLRRR